MSPTGIAVDANLFYFVLMPTLVVFEDEGFRHLLPLTYWRTCFELRVGYARLFDHIRSSVNPKEIVLSCRTSLSAIAADRFQLPVNEPPDCDAVLFVNGRLLVTEPLKTGPMPAVQWADGQLLIVQADKSLCQRLKPNVLSDPSAARKMLADVPQFSFIESPRVMRYPWDLVHANADMLVRGWQQAASPGLTGRVCEGAHLLNPSAIHLGSGSTIKPGAVLDAENGPIFIGEGVTVSANASIEGPCYIGDKSVIQPSTRLRGNISIGPRCKIGGELEACIIHGFSNKQHDGFLGHSYVAEWVNLAADTVSSDLKNTYGTIRVPINGEPIESNQMFVGLTIGDHSKTGIGQMFPTGAVVGFGCNVATAGFAPQFVPSFSWLTTKDNSRWEVHRCLDVARRVMARRDVKMTAAEEALFLSLPIHVGHFEGPFAGT
jgi:UDP-N-acetylglucosamine diphosphorylase / glucose-1-phosphate thymidylyltransferase / UDP-N-acetylgalactosamine diphosphorylase / glucosamine-1-phosphate N-acetyltransferase / galactosamine-1-phosphate N-acetyltransferase